MAGCVPSTIKYLLFLFNLLIFLMGCVALGFSIYALVDGKTVSHLVEDGAAELGESITVDIYRTSAIILIIASSVVVLISFLGCCGAIKENRFLLFSNFVSLLVVFLTFAVGATIAAFQNIDQLKQPLLSSMVNYDPNSQIEDDLVITRAWDDVQREFACCGVNNYTDWVSVNGTIYPDSDKNLVPPSCCNDMDASSVKECRINPSDPKFSSKMSGCFTAFKASLEKSKSTIGIVTGSIIGIMFCNLILLFGFALCIAPQGYNQV